MAQSITARQHGFRRAAGDTIAAGCRGMDVSPQRGLINLDAELGYPAAGEVRNKAGPDGEDVAQNGDAAQDQIDGMAENATNRRRFSGQKHDVAAAIDSAVSAENYAAILAERFHGVYRRLAGGRKQHHRRQQQR